MTEKENQWMQIGARLSNCRQNKNMTQEELARPKHISSGSSAIRRFFPKSACISGTSPMPACISLGAPTPSSQSVLGQLGPFPGQWGRLCLQGGALPSVSLYGS